MPGITFFCKDNHLLGLSEVPIIVTLLHVRRAFYYISLMHSLKQQREKRQQQQIRGFDDNINRFLLIKPFRRNPIIEYFVLATHLPLCLLKRSLSRGRF